MSETKKTSQKSKADEPRRADPEVRSLILRARDGSREAYITLRSKYRPLLDAAVARFGPSEMSRQEYADLQEEAERIFISAITSYDTEQGAVEFGLYAKICIRNGLISAWRHLNLLRRQSPLPLPEETTAVQEDPSARIVEEERFHALAASVRSQLSDYENRVWWPYVTGVSVPEIAAMLGTEERSVHNAIYRIRRKLRAYLTERRD